uniref:Sushi domain-containing protein n=1 Tax=Cyprinodon variegatus TaxID=28743 RepID=A0A3Q2CMR6_CYPVA
MWLRGLGIALLVWIPAALHAESVERRCRAPELRDGYFLPLNESYPHESEITYGCDTGFKPIVEGWWARSICRNGVWVKEPQCVEEKACLPPDIPNAENEKKSKDWYENGSEIQFECKAGYSFNKPNNTARCIDGTWISVSDCVERPSACGRPPKIPNAVVLQNQHQELFDEYSKAVYYCKDGFLTEDEERMKIVRCIFGNWTAGPTCTPSTRLGTKVTEPSYIPIDNCGSHPLVPNGEPLVHRSDQLKYTCNRYYKLVGPEIVRCRSDLTWSELPTCKENYCLLRNGAYEELILTKDEYILNNEKKEFECLSDKYLFKNYAMVRCIDQELHVSECCNRAQINLRMC